MRDLIAAFIIVSILVFVVLPVLVLNRHRLREPITHSPGIWEWRLIKRAATAVYSFVRSKAARISGRRKKGK